MSTFKLQKEATLCLARVTGCKPDQRLVAADVNDLFAKCAAVAEDNAFRSRVNDLDDVMTHAVTSNIQFEVDYRNSNCLAPLSDQSPPAVGIPVIFIRIVRTGDESDWIRSTGR